MLVHGQAGSRSVTSCSRNRRPRSRRGQAWFARPRAARSARVALADGTNGQAASAEMRSVKSQHLAEAVQRGICRSPSSGAVRARPATWIPPKPGPARPGPHWFWALRHPAGSVTTGLCALTDRAAARRCVQADGWIWHDTRRTGLLRYPRRRARRHGRDGLSMRDYGRRNLTRPCARDQQASQRSCLGDHRYRSPCLQAKRRGAAWVWSSSVDYCLIPSLSCRVCQIGAGR